MASDAMLREMQIVQRLEKEIEESERHLVQLTSELNAKRKERAEHAARLADLVIHYVSSVSKPEGAQKIVTSLNKSENNELASEATTHSAGMVEAHHSNFKTDGALTPIAHAKSNPTLTQFSSSSSARFGDRSGSKQDVSHHPEL